MIAGASEKINSQVGVQSRIEMATPQRSLRTDIRQDIVRAAWERMPGFTGEPTTAQMVGAFCRPTTLVVLAYRLNRAAMRLKIPVIKQLLMIPTLLFDRVMMIMTGVVIVPQADIGPGFLIHTPYGINIGGTKIGENCTVASGVVIGGGSYGVGNNVYFGAGSKLIGDAKIGNNVVIVANSLVLTDVKDNLTVIGVPARIKLRGGNAQRFPPVATLKNPRTK